MTRVENIPLGHSSQKRRALKIETYKQPKENLSAEAKVLSNIVTNFSANRVFQ